MNMMNNKTKRTVRCYETMHIMFVLHEIIFAINNYRICSTFGRHMFGKLVCDVNWRVFGLAARAIQITYSVWIRMSVDSAYI